MIIITVPIFAFKGIVFIKCVIENQQYITLNAISREVLDVYKRYGFTGRSRVIHNGAREDMFLYDSSPEFANKSIYVGKIEYRKAQWKYQNIEGMEFAGNFHGSPFQTSNPNYLGEWTKNVLYERLTKYANLVLLSDGEADPLVVKEALIAGLGVVVSECASANLDLSKDFITVIPNNKLTDLKYVENAINANRLISIARRDEIRDYGLRVFSWKSIIHKYNQIINKSS